MEGGRHRSPLRPGTQSRFANNIIDGGSPAQKRNSTFSHPLQLLWRLEEFNFLKAYCLPGREMSAEGTKLDLIASSGANIRFL